MNLRDLLFISAPMLLGFWYRYNNWKS